MNILSRVLLLLVYADSLLRTVDLFMSY